MFKLKKLLVIAVMILTSLSSVVNADNPDSGLLDTIIAGVAYSDSLISNISFDYVVDYNVSEEWRNNRIEFYKRVYSDLAEETELRVQQRGDTSFLWMVGGPSSRVWGGGLCRDL